MNVLQTIDLKKQYGSEPNITRALDGVNLSVPSASSGHAAGLAVAVILPGPFMIHRILLRRSAPLSPARGTAPVSARCMSRL